MVYLKSSLLEILIIVLVICLSVLSEYGAAGNHSSVSGEENMEIERQLKILNKPPIKTIITKKGDTVDCIDIYKQPAFDHPLLKDHKIQLKPSYFKREENVSQMDSFPTKVSSLQINELQKEVMCPVGTIPIRRTTKQELIFSDFLKKSKQNHTNGYPLKPMYHHFVSVETAGGSGYFGGKAMFGIHNPPATPDQFTTSQMWIQNGPSGELNSIETGWAVYPGLFGDHETRTFSYWTADGYKNTGCFNMLCPGFVQVHPRVSFGTVLNPIIITGQQEMFFWVYRDQKTHNWWYYIGNDDTMPIGYWPKELFPHLQEEASVVRFGGRAGAKESTPSPAMGNGRLPTEDYKMEETGFMRYLQVLEEGGETSYFGNSRIIKKDLDTKSGCYELYFRKYGYWKRSKMGYNSMIFGGPGGSDCV